MSEANTTLQPPEGLIAVDAVDIGHSNGVHDLSDCLQFMKQRHGILQGYKEMAEKAGNMESRIKDSNEIVVSNKIENQSNRIVVEAWSSERGVINEVYTNPQCFIVSEDVNDTKGVCFSSKSYLYSAEKRYVLGQSEETQAIYVNTAVNCHTSIRQESFRPLSADLMLTAFVQGQGECLLQNHIIAEISHNIIVKKRNPNGYQRGIDVDLTNGSSNENDEDDANSEDLREKNIKLTLNSSICSHQYCFPSCFPSNSSSRTKSIRPASLRCTEEGKVREAISCCQW